ncbi:MAG: hypothetical protein VYB34_02750, partial [Planctomycetota bacterium]|nr:hypothetical protein [Planctomycetota bacterium]
KHLSDDKASVRKVNKTDFEACNRPVLQAGCETNSAGVEKRAIFALVERRTPVERLGQAEYPRERVTE